MRRRISFGLLMGDLVIVVECLRSGHPGQFRFPLTFALISAVAFTISLAASRRRS